MQARKGGEKNVREWGKEEERFMENMEFRGGDSKNLAIERFEDRECNGERNV